MESVTFKKSGILYNIHKFISIQDATDTCSFKRSVILSIIMCLATPHATLIRGILHLFSEYREDNQNHGIVTHLVFVLLTFLGTMIGVGVSEHILDPINWESLIQNQQYFIGFLWTFYGLLVGMISLTVFVACIAAAGAIIYGIWKVLEALWELTQPKIEHIFTSEEGEPKTQVGLLYKSAKEKWCKKIDWEGNDDDDIGFGFSQ